MSVHGTDGWHRFFFISISANLGLGPITLAFPTLLPGWDTVLQDTLEKEFGFPRVLEPVRLDCLIAVTIILCSIQQGGNIKGTCMSLSTVNPRTNKRAYSAEAYLEPVLDRPNLKVLVGAPVTKVISENASGLLVATGAEFNVDGKSYTTWATDEVILSAGYVSLTVVSKYRC